MSQDGNGRVKQKMSVNRFPLVLAHLESLYKQELLLCRHFTFLAEKMKTQRNGVRYSLAHVWNRTLKIIGRLKFDGDETEWVKQRGRVCERLLFKCIYLFSLIWQATGYSTNFMHEHSSPKLLHNVQLLRQSARIMTASWLCHEFGP